MYLCLLQRVCVWPCSRCPVTTHLVCLSSSVWKSVRSNQYMTGTHLGNGAYHATTSTRSWLWAAGPRKGLGAGIAARPAPRSSPGGDLAAGRAPGAASALCAFSLLSPPPSPAAERRRSRPLPGGRRGRSQSAPAAVAMRAPTLPGGRAPRCAPPRRLAAGMDRAPRGPGVYGAPGLGSGRAAGPGPCERGGRAPCRGWLRARPLRLRDRPRKVNPARLCAGACRGLWSEGIAVGAAAAVLRRPQREGCVWSGEAGRLVPGLPAGCRLRLPLPCWGDRATPARSPAARLGSCPALPCHGGHVLFSLLQQEETCSVFFSAGINARKHYRSSATARLSGGERS